MDAQILGAAAEDYAVHYLKRKAYQIRKQNYRFLKAEIDIIAQIDDFLVIVEVKARTTSIFGKPEEFVTPKKIKLIVSAADEYLQRENIQMEVRFDIVAVLRQHGKWEVSHLENAFYPFDGD